MSMGRQHFQQFPEPYDEIVFADGKSYGFMNGRDKAIEKILSGFVTGEELKEITRVYMEMYRDIHQGFVALGLSKVLPWWLQFLLKPKVDLLRRYAAFTVNDVQYAVFNLGYSKEQLLSQPCHRALPSYANLDSMELKRLKAILAHPVGDYGVQPRDASFAAHGVTAEHYIEGGSYTVGPTQNISINLLGVIRAYGGEAFVDATVRNIIVENGKAIGVRVTSTTAVHEMGDNAPTVEIRAKNIVAATSVYNTYDKLLPQDLDVVKKFNDPAERTIRQSNGHNFVFCKLRGDPDELNLPDHNIWYFEDDLDSAYDEFYAHPSSCRPPVVYIGFPCTKDPTWKKRFPGISNCIVISDG
jgi:phytoene dehydrogenase-like protein